MPPTTYPHETPDRYISLLGLVSSGDLGSLTCYRSKRGKVVIFSKTWPKFPPTLAQLTGRARMSFGAEQWRGLTNDQKATWRNTIRKSPFVCTGYGFWQHWYHKPNLREMQEIHDRTGIWLPNYITRTPPALPANAKITPSTLSDPPVTGQARYARKLILIPPNTTEYTAYLACHPGLPAQQPVTAYWTTLGPGSFTATPLLNMRWCRVSFTSTAQLWTTRLYLDAHFSDGSEDQTYTTFLCRNF